MAGFGGVLTVSRMILKLAFTGKKKAPRVEMPFNYFG